MFEASPPTLDLDPDHVAKVVAVLVGEDAGHLNGRVIHAAAGAVREYGVRRTAESEAVAWLAEAVKLPWLSSTRPSHERRRPAWSPISRPRRSA